MMMAITEIKKGDSTYILFGYKDGEKNVKIYCGKKGLKKTEQNIKKAKKIWYKARIAKMQQKMSE